ncbi:MAG: RND family transporter [Thermoleophilaceae bacterium]
MWRSDPFERVVRLATRRPLAVLGVVGLLALVGAGLALRLEPSAATDTLVNRSSSSFKATERFKRSFGDDPVVVLVKGDLPRTILTSDLGRLLRLEGCLSGRVGAKGLAQLPSVCSKIAKLKPARVVYGPATFINTAVGQINGEFSKERSLNELSARQAAELARRAAARRGASKRVQEGAAKTARQAVLDRFTQDVMGVAVRYGLTSIPSIDNPQFVSTLVFDRTQHQPSTPKSKFGYLFPSRSSALIQARLRPDLTGSERRQAIQLYRQALREPLFKPQRGASYVLTGVPVVAEGLASAVQHSILVLLGAVLLVMAATLALVFRTRLRLLPLLLALGAAGMTFGALSLAGGSLTMASIAVLPVLIGLAVDYAIQFHARFDEARSRDPGGGLSAAARSAALTGGPTIFTAGLATAVGFLVLLLSPVPMVRSFGLLLVLGIGLALLVTVSAGFAALTRFDPSQRRPVRVPWVVRRLGGEVAYWMARVAAAPPVVAAREWLADHSWRALGYALTRPRRVLAIGLVIALCGWALDTQTAVVSDVRQLVPQNLQALRDVNQLQDRTGVSGEIDVTVRADDITQPAVVRWMTRFQDGVLGAHGYGPGKTCAQAKNPPELCPALSLPGIFGTVSGPRGSQQVRALLDAIPPYFSQGVVSQDRRSANLAFGIRLMPLDRQKRVVDDIKARLRPPKGVQASVVGLPVLAAEANADLSSPWRRALTLLAALAGVFLVLLAVRRSRRAAAVPLIPIALASGWSGAVLFFLGLLPGPLEVDLNPMSVTLGALVIAISTEFSVLLSSRYRQEREAGAGPARAVELAYASTGAAVLASGSTAIAGFAVLVVSNIRMLRDFGIVTVVDLTAALVGVMLVLPAALMWAEQHGPFTLRDLDPRPLLQELWDARPSPPQWPLRRRRSAAR